jgi:hypothetical protein
LEDEEYARIKELRRGRKHEAEESLEKLKRAKG